MALRQLQQRRWDLARRGAQVVLIGIVVGAALGWLQGADLRGYGVSILYSQCIGLISWLCIDPGRFLVYPHLQGGWPEGWRGPAQMIAGCSIGFAGGLSLADALAGHDHWAQLQTRPRAFFSTLAMSALLGAAVSMFYYLRGKQARQSAQLAQAERDATLARLTLLQSQLEPHMLFNTLANLRALISLDPARAQAMLDRLVAFLRATLLASRSASHPLAQEFERLADYLALMAVRMGPRLRVECHLPPELAALPVPPLLLQPLVENAILHGLEPQVQGGLLRLSATRHGSDLWLEVYDSGKGLQASGQAGSGFGLSQVRERLATLYGAQATLDLQNMPAGGTLARINLPFAAMAAPLLAAVIPMSNNGCPSKP